MKKRLSFKVITLSFILLVCNYAGQSQCKLDKTQWKVVFDEEFNETSISNLFKNNTSDLNPNNGYDSCCWISGGINGCPYASTCDTGTPPHQNNENIVMFTPLMVQMNAGGPPANPDATGLAYFNAEKNPGNVPKLACWNGSAPPADDYNTYLVSEISSTHTDFPSIQNWGGYPTPGFIYGMFEIRCKLPKTALSYTSFWLAGDSWPPEIDAFESCIYDVNTDQNKFFSSIHWGPNTNPLDVSTFYQYQALNTFDLYSDFHTWDIVWTPTEVAWFLDGEELKVDNDPTQLPNPGPTISNYFCENFFAWNQMHIILGQALGCVPDPPGSETFDPFIVDYVKVYRPNNYVPFVENGSPTEFLDYYNSQNSLYANTTYRSTTDWTSYVIQTAQYEPVSVANGLKSFEGGGAYMYKGTNGQLNLTYYGSGNAFYSIVDNWSYPAPDDNSIMLSDDGNTTFYTNYGSIYSVGTGGLTNYGISYVKNVIPNITNSNQFYILSIFGDLYYYSNGSTPLITSNVSGSLTVNPYDWNDIYYIGTDNNVHEINRTTNTTYAVTTSGDVSGPLAVTSLPTNSAAREIYFRSNTGTLNYTLFNTSAWEVERTVDIGGLPVNNVSVNNILIDPNFMIGTTDVPDQQIYYVGTDQRPWIIYNTSTAVWKSNYIDVDLPNVAGDFNFIFGQSPNDANIKHISYRDINGLIRTLEYQSCDNIQNASNDPANPAQQVASIKYDSTLKDKINYNALINNNVIAIADSSFQNMNVRNMQHTQNAQDISIYPNPTSGISFISFNNINKVSRVSISTADGKSADIPVIVNNNQMEVDMTNYLPGLYVVTVYTPETVKTFKLTRY